MRLASPIQVRPIRDLVEQHVEDAALHWMRRQRALGAPHYYFSNHLGEPGGDVGHLDRRLQAHLDGARLAGDLAWELACDLLSTGEAPEVFVAGILAIQSPDSARLDAVLAAVLAEPASARGLVSALGWLSFPDIEPLARRLALADAPPLQALGLAAFAVHRHEPPTLLEALDAPEPLPRRRALQAVGELARRDLLPRLREHLDDEDPACRHRAAVSTALLGDRRGAEHLLDEASGTDDSVLAERAARQAARHLPSTVIATWATQHMRHGAPNRRMAIAALGEAGDPALIPHLLISLPEPELARLAGEALTRITGVNLVDQGLEAPTPEGFVAGPSDDPADNDMDLDPDEDLPWPDPDALPRWWSAHASTWIPGQRYLLGRSITRPGLIAILHTGSQRERLTAAHHLLALQPNTPLFEHRAPTHRQLQRLGPHLYRQP